MKPATQKVGRITVALGLIVFGIALLLDNMGSTQNVTSWVYKLWPVILIGFGGEYLVRTVLAQRSGSENPAPLRFDIGGAILLLLVVALSFGITTARSWFSDETGRITFAGGDAVIRSDSAVLALDDAREVQVNVDAGTVRLLQHSKPDEIRIESTYTARGFIVDRERVRQDLDQIKLSATSGDVVKIRADMPRDLNNITVSYTIYAPPGLTVKAETGAGMVRVTDYKGDLHLSSGAGSIYVEAGAGSVAANSGAGSVVVRNFEGPVSARAGTGRLEVHNVVGNIQLDSGAGQISIREFTGGKLIADTRMGSIHADTSSVLSGDVVLKTSAGTINLTLPGESSMRASAQTRAGSLTLPSFMSANGNGPARSGMGTAGDGKYTVTLEAGTGSIHFNTRGQTH